MAGPYRYEQQQGGYHPPNPRYGVPQGYDRDDEPSQPPAQPPAPRAPHSSGPNYRWWIPEQGIRREVITADIQRYLGPDALVRPGEGSGQYAVGAASHSGMTMCLLV